MSNVTESAIVSSEFSKLKIDDVDDSADIDSRHSSISGSDIKGAITAASEFDDIDLWRVKDRVNVRAKRGKVHIGLLDGPETEGGFSIDMRIAYGDIRSDIRLQEDEISLSETRATGVHGSGSVPVSVYAEYTDISLTLDN